MAQLEVSDVAGTAVATTPLEDGRIVMTLCGSRDTYVRLGEDYIESGCRVRDREEGFLTDSVVTSGSVDTSKVGDYTITYTVTNAEGMQAQCERVVHVADDMEWDTDGIPVTMYHYVYDPEDPPDDVGSNHVSTDEFEAQLEWLTSEGFYFPSWEELRAYIDGTHSLPAKSIILSFDDGEIGFLTYGAALLEKYQVPATSFIICDYEFIEDILSDYASPYVQFESHSYGLHQSGSSGQGRGGRIYDLSVDELVDDLQHTADILDAHSAFAYPFGDVSDTAKEALDRAGYLCAVTTENDQAHVGDDYSRIPRVRVFGGNSLDSFKASVL
ncbi:MAG: DUF5011 domain-containing protein [Eggerthellaceae bacterium]|nr:DUF5011 domain-containing protein [Eggerthellaceae bacterium]